jgi:hypothetical protein
MKQHKRESGAFYVFTLDVIIIDIKGKTILFIYFSSSFERDPDGR